MAIVPAIKTPAEQTQGRIVAINERLLSVMQDLLTDGFNAFWHTPGVEAQEVADLFGTDAPKLLDYHARLVTIVAEICMTNGRPITAPTAIPADKQYTIENELLVITNKEPVE